MGCATPIAIVWHDRLAALGRVPVASRLTVRNITVVVVVDWLPVGDLVVASTDVACNSASEQSNSDEFSE